jgi:hypothetical protein
MTKARDLSNIISGGFTADDIPSLDTAKITTGTFAAARIDNTSLSNVTALPFSAGTDWQSTIVTGSTLSAVAGKGYWINTTSNACTITLPASASVGDFIEFSDYARTWGTNAITINQNSLNFQGYTSPNPEYNTSGQSVKLIYSGATQGWIPTVDDDVTFETAQPPYTIEYLVVAGGGSGGGGHRSGGGGAGGYRNSYASETSGRNSSTETPLSMYSGTTLTITVGAGGAMPYNGLSAINGNAGNSSSISGTGITTITSYGGGGGGGYTLSATAGTYGSGGGGGQDTDAGTSGSNGTAGQGFDGGDTNSGSGLQQGGSGGGAGANGQTGGTTSATAGGVGLSSSITGSAVFRAGGGGAGSYGSGGYSSGGSGGGGNGGSDDAGDPHSGVLDGDSYYYPLSGTDNTGGGGGGMAGPNSDGTSYGSGGSGVVILRMPTAKYTGTYTGAETPIVDGSDTILVFNSSGSYTT